MIMISNFLFKITDFCIIIFFSTKLLTSDILFSTVVNAFFVAKLLTSRILFSNSVSFGFLTKSVTSGIFFSSSVLSVYYLVFKAKSLVSILFTFAANLSYTVFLTTSFLTISFNLLKSAGTDANFSMSILSTSVFRIAKFVFSAKPKYQRMLHFLDQFLLHNLKDQLLD